MNKKDGRITQDFICIPTENSINVNIDEKLIKELKDNHEVIYMSTVECSKYDFKITRIGYLFNVSHKNDYNKMLKSFKTIPECLEFIKNYKYKETKMKLKMIETGQFSWDCGDFKISQIGLLYNIYHRSNTDKVIITFECLSKCSTFIEGATFGINFATDNANFTTTQEDQKEKTQNLSTIIFK